MKKGNVCTAAAILAALFLTAGCSMELMFENEQDFLNAIAKQEVYTVTYDGNGACHGMVPSLTMPYELHDTVEILGNDGELFRTGFIFAGWNTKEDGRGHQYQPGDTFTMVPKQVVLYAQWDYRIGTTGPGGGTVFYDKGAYSDGWRYLEAAPYGWYNGASDPLLPWKPSSYDRPVIFFIGDNKPIGLGAINTATIISQIHPETDYAAHAAASYDGGGFTDWYLPSKHELQQMRWRRMRITGFVHDQWYWSSSVELIPGQPTEVWCCLFEVSLIDIGSTIYTRTKSKAEGEMMRVRPIRAF